MSDQVIIQGTISGRTKVVLNKIMDAPMPEDGILIVKAPENSPSYAFSGSLISGANTYHIGFRNTSGNGMPSGYYLMP